MGTVVLVLGFSNMRDAAAAIVADGRLLAAAEEERFVRQKHVTALPVQAIQYCLREAGVTLRDVDTIAVPWKYWQVGRRIRLAVTAMARSRQLFRVKGTRSLERVGQEWKELFRLSRELTQRVDKVGRAPLFLDHHL
ncbi:MAG TPA: carbamoyltransferase N-terminal domain-containing protein, partial [Nitrospira sp.]|nr:carbamoyltransferase N-terminal domain-containing protein [Nitrospira sp.]